MCEGLWYNVLLTHPLPLKRLTGGIKSLLKYECDFWKCTKMTLLFALLSINVPQYLSDSSIERKFRIYPDELQESAIKPDYF